MPTLTSPRYWSAINIPAIRVMEFRISCTVGLHERQVGECRPPGRWRRRLGFVHFVDGDIGPVRSWERSRSGRNSLRAVRRCRETAPIRSIPVRLANPK